MRPRAVSCAALTVTGLVKRDSSADSPALCTFVPNGNAAFQSPTLLPVTLFSGETLNVLHSSMPRSAHIVELAKYAIDDAEGRAKLLLADCRLTTKDAIKLVSGFPARMNHTIARISQAFGVSTNFKFMIQYLDQKRRIDVIILMANMQMSNATLSLYVAYITYNIEACKRAIARFPRSTWIAIYDAGHAVSRVSKEVSLWLLSVALSMQEHSGAVETFIKSLFDYGLYVAADGRIVTRVQPYSVLSTLLHYFLNSQSTDSLNPDVYRMAIRNASKLTAIDRPDSVLSQALKEMAARGEYADLAVLGAITNADIDAFLCDADIPDAEVNAAMAAVLNCTCRNAMKYNPVTRLTRHSARTPKRLYTDVEQRYQDYDCEPSGW